MCVVISTDTDSHGRRTLLEDTFPAMPPATEPSKEDWESPPPRYSEAPERANTPLSCNDTDSPGTEAHQNFPVNLKMDLCRIYKVSSGLIKLGKAKDTKHDLLLLDMSMALPDIYTLMNEVVDKRFGLANAVTSLSAMGERWHMQCLNGHLPSEVVPLTRENVPAVLAMLRNKFRHGKPAGLVVSFAVIHGTMELQKKPGLLARLARRITGNNGDETATGAVAHVMPVS